MAASSPSNYLRRGAVGRFTLAPSTIVSGKSRVTVVGEMTSETGSEGAAVWPFKNRCPQGTLAAEDFRLPSMPLDSASAEGVVIPSTGIIKLNPLPCGPAAPAVALAAKLRPASVRSVPASRGRSLR